MLRSIIDHQWFCDVLVTRDEAGMLFVMGKAKFLAELLTLDFKERSGREMSGCCIPADRGEQIRVAGKS